MSEKASCSAKGHTKLTGRTGKTVLEADPCRALIKLVITPVKGRAWLERHVKFPPGNSTANAGLHLQEQGRWWLDGRGWKEGRDCSAEGTGAPWPPPGKSQARGPSRDRWDLGRGKGGTPAPWAGLNSLAARCVPCASESLPATLSPGGTELAAHDLHAQTRLHWRVTSFSC